MLPPFVPPSARAATEALPSITQFVVDPTEHSIDTTSSGPALLTAPVVRSTHVGSTSNNTASSTRSNSTPFNDAFSTSELSTSELSAPELSAPELSAPELSAPAVAEPAHEEPEEELPSIDEFVLAKAEVADVGPKVGQNVGPDVVPTETPARAEEGAAWVDEERNAFNWQALAHLAPGADEERRAAEAWQSTEWDSPATTGAEHVANMLLQVARLVRSGELRVEVTRGMSTEVALSAVLTALLSDAEAMSGAPRR